MPGYSNPEQMRSFPLTAVAIISGNTTLRGPLMKHPGTIVGADVSSASNHIADDATNHWVINVRANGNTAWSLNTAVTDVNASTVTFPTQNSTNANLHFAAGEEITAILNQSSSDAVNFPIGMMIWVHYSESPDLHIGGA